MVDIKVLEIIDNPDGSATVSWEMDDAAKDKLVEVALGFLLRCAAYGVDLQTALDSIKDVKKDGTPA